MTEKFIFPCGTKDAAQYLGITVAGVWKATKKKKNPLEARKIGGHLLFTEEALDAYRATAKEGKPRQKIDRRAMKNDYLDRLPVETIATKYGVSTATIYARLREWKVPRRGRGPAQVIVAPTPRKK